MDKLESVFGHRLIRGLQMKDLTTVCIGGPVEALVVARTTDELVVAIQAAREEGLEYLVLGGGSNLLVADEGLKRLVIKNEAVGIQARGDAILVNGGTSLQDLVDFSIEHGLAGLQRLTGVPGTVGGAIYGNAGAYGQTISDSIEQVICFDGDEVVALQKSECQFAYRTSRFKVEKLTVLEARFRLVPAHRERLLQEAEAVLKQRLLKYPVGLRCSGSFFKNVIASDLPHPTLALIPEDKILYGKVPAGYLLEQVGAKGRSLGGIRVSTASANLFVNEGEGKASELHQLASEQAAKVRDRYGITLEPEVQLVNLPPLYVDGA